ncbi:uncharacterized protein LOC144908968 isoform X1 [Branchiostoma floridae x Branchiostoma belcheri]
MIQFTIPNVVQLSIFSLVFTQITDNDRPTALKEDLRFACVQMDQDRLASCNWCKLGKSINTDFLANKYLKLSRMAGEYHFQTTLMLLVFVLWLDMGDSILTGQQAEQITNRIERLKTKVDAVNLKVARTTETLNNLAETGLPEVPFVPTPTTSPGVNVALGKTAFQTTTVGYHVPSMGLQLSGEARLAVDGNTNGNFIENSCTHTDGEDNPAWWVDLGQSYPVIRVVIFNRMDSCCSERLNPFNIHIGGSSQVTANPKCGGDHRIDLSEPSISISCQEMLGRYVGIRLTGSQSRAMNLCEVQVFSNPDQAVVIPVVPTPTPTPTPSPGVNVALGKTAFQTTTMGYHSGSTGEQWPGVARLAVDGNTNGDHWGNSCTHTDVEANAMWWVDLGQSYTIYRVVIFNRLDCCSERLNPFNIHIGNSDQVTWNPKCGGDHQINLNEPSISVSCQGMTGRYVGVRLAGSQTRALSLCEVQVFSN